MSRLAVLYEDNHCLAVVKPAGMLTMGDVTGDRSLVEEAADYLRDKYQKPGNVFVGIVHRLDRPVSGVVLFARTSKAAGRLAEQFRTGSVEKVYHALVEGEVPPEGTLIDWLLKEPETNTVRVVRGPGQQSGTERSQARHSVLTFRCLERQHRRALLEVRPVTGRSHQIRVQLAHAGFPILGDGKYGSKVAVEGCICLHAHQLIVDHPVKHVPLILTAPRTRRNWPEL